MQAVCRALFCLLFISINISIFSNKNINTKTEQNKTDVGSTVILEALYFRTNDIESNAPSNENFIGLNFDTQYAWGFRLAGLYQWGEAQDRRIQWWHYRNDFSNESNRVHQLKGEGSTLVPYSYSSDFDLIMYELGRTLYFTDSMSIRLHGGLEYAYLHVGYRFNYVTNITQSSQRFSKFYFYNGIGPRVGLSLMLDIKSSFNLLMGGAITVLGKWGTHDFDSVQIDRRAGQPDRVMGVEVENKINGILMGADTNIEINYKTEHRFGQLIYSGGLKGIVFLEDMTKWGGFIFGIKWHY